MEQAAQGKHKVHRVKRDIVEPIPVTLPAKSPAQDLAERIWAGQSVDALTREERLERVKRGLESQGMSMEGVTL